MVYSYIYASVLIVSLISVVLILPFLKILNKKNVMITLLSVSAGTLLGTVFIHFLPESIAQFGYKLSLPIYLLTGFLVMFIVEKFIHHHHHIGVDHHHAYHLAPVNLIGDGIHNFIDGMVIAGAYLVNIPLGIAATVSVIAHEVPQEIADFGVLLYSGWEQKKALIFNFMSALTCVIGATVAIFLQNSMQGFSEFILPFAAGNFLYIAASNLVPELHRECGLKESILHIVAIIAGIGIMLALTLYGPAHVH